MADTYPDMLAAAVAWLRADPAIVAAFGEDASTPAGVKFWGDHAEGSPGLPYLVYEEMDEVPERETRDPAQPLDANAEGHFAAHVYGATKLACRQLGALVATALKDAPLVFADGELLQLRASGQWSEDDGQLGVGTPVEYHRIVEFRYLASRST